MGINIKCDNTSTSLSLPLSIHVFCFIFKDTFVKSTSTSRSRLRYLSVLLRCTSLDAGRRWLQLLYWREFKSFSDYVEPFISRLHCLMKCLYRLESGAKSAILSGHSVFCTVICFPLKTNESSLTRAVVPLHERLCLELVRYRLFFCEWPLILFTVNQSAYWFHCASDQRYTAYKPFSSGSAVV